MMIPVDSVELLYCYKESHFWTGAGLGLLAGVLVGGVIGMASVMPDKPDDPKSVEDTAGRLLMGIEAMGAAITGGCIGGMGGLVVGGMLGAGSNTRYELSAMNRGRKIATLSAVMKSAN